MVNKILASLSNKSLFVASIGTAISTYYLFEYMLSFSLREFWIIMLIAVMVYIAFRGNDE